MFYSMNKLIKYLNKPKYSNKCIQASKSKHLKIKSKDKIITIVSEKPIKQHKSKNQEHVKREEKYSRKLNKCLKERLEADQHERGDTKYIHTQFSEIRNELSTLFEAKPHKHRKREQCNLKEAYTIDEKELRRMKIKQQIFRFQNVKRLLKLEKQLERVLLKLDLINSKYHKCQLKSLNNTGTQYSLEISLVELQSSSGACKKPESVENLQTHEHSYTPEIKLSNNKLISTNLQSTSDELQMHLDNLKCRIRQRNLFLNTDIETDYCKKCFMSRDNCTCPDYKIDNLEGSFINVSDNILENCSNEKPGCSYSEDNFIPISDLCKHFKQEEKVKKNINKIPKITKPIKFELCNKHIDVSNPNQLLKGTVHFPSKTRIDFELGCLDKAPKKKIRKSAKYYKQLINAVSNKTMSEFTPSSNYQTSKVTNKNSSGECKKENSNLKTRVSRQGKAIEHSKEFKNYSTPNRDRKLFHKDKENISVPSRTNYVNTKKSIFKSIDEFENKKLGGKQVALNCKGSGMKLLGNDIRCNTLITVNK